MDKQHFFLKLIPPRPTFSQDMTEDERNIMNRHIEYWTHLLNKGTVIVYGPVFDPNGAYGIGIIEVENEEQAKTIAENDPAPVAGLGYYEIYPMRAITPGKR
jgi:uncharacterized protein